MSVVHQELIEANGVSLWTVKQGSGPPLVLCHGGPGIYDYLGAVAGMIDDLATVYRYDQRGCGRSERVEPYDVATFVNDLDALREHWGHDSWTVAGHSWGAELALMYALQHPDRTQALVYISGTGIDPAWHGEFHRNLEDRLSPQDRDLYRELRKRRNTATGDELQRIRDKSTRLHEPTEYYDVTQLDEIPHFDEFPINYELNTIMSKELSQIEDSGRLAREVMEIKAPTLILDGEADPRPRWSSAQLAGLIPNARHVVIDKTGHIPWVERPEATKQALREFISELA